MNHTNRNGFLKAACLMPVVLALSACVLPGTLVKYYTDTEMQSKEFMFGNLTITVTQAQTAA